MILETPPHFLFNQVYAHGYQNMLEHSRGPLNVIEYSEIMRIYRQLLRWFNQILHRKQGRHIKKHSEKKLELL